MSVLLASLAAGVLFGVGLAVAQMVNPVKVLAFLDLAGDWDPSLAFVLAGAAGTALLGFRIVQSRLRAPLFAAKFRLPTKRNIDRPLVLGAALFGIGWGLVGLCPGPALADLGLAADQVGLFVLAMLVGMAAHRCRGARVPAPHVEAGTSSRLRGI